MEYTKVQQSFTRAALMRGADPASRGVWLSLNCYCADQENGGTIRACRAWTERQWSAVADATKAEVEAAIAQGMARWEGDDLEVNGYDKVGEAHYQVEREANRARANARWEKKRADDAAEAARMAGSRETKPPVMPPVPKVDAAGIAAGTAGGGAAGSPPVMPSPDQSRPVHAIPPTPPAGAGGGEGVGVGGEERIPSKAENTAALEAMLVKLTCATGPGATPRWAGVAEQAKARNLPDALECLRWLILHARSKGVPVVYASDVLPFLDAWKWHRQAQRPRAQGAA